MAEPVGPPSDASSISSLQSHEDLANQIAADAPQPDRAQPVAHANEGKDIEEVVDPERAAQNTGHGQNGKGWQLLCGPMLKYARLSDESKRWHGSVLIVLRAPDEETAKHPDEPSISLDAPSSNTKPVHLFTERDRVYWRFNMDLALGNDEREVKYSVELPQHQGGKIERSFWVPKLGQTFRIMFHSCNGFVPGAEKEVNGLALWNDVLRLHEKSPLHVMIGGGDQIYSDGVTEPHAPLYPWAQELSPRKRSKIPFPLELRDKVDDWYFQHHCDWFNASPFREANSQIPQLNLWDDHDIIDGFGTYRDAWQRAPVFMGVGEIAWKYMSLFQQHLPPSTTTPGLTYDPKNFDSMTSPAHQPTPEGGKGHKIHVPKTRAERDKIATSRPENASKANGNGAANGNGDSNEKQNGKQKAEDDTGEPDPSYIRHPQQGPYMQHRGLSICTSLGEGVLFYGLDCRTDRTRDRICYADTYQIMFDTLEKEIIQGKTKHVLLLLGVPIAYPRLVWAETLMTSHLMAPLRMLNKMFGIMSGLFNDFDGKAELLDDLEDHWAAATHKAERNHFVQRLQALSYAKQVRITILSGDVHLAAVGRFFSKAKLNVPQEKDHRYIVNIISSAITNAPPPEAVGDVLNARNKLHRLDHNTAENLMNIFEEGVDGSNRLVNKTTYTARNYCVITRADPGAGPDETTAEEIGDNPAQQESNDNQGEKPKVSLLGKAMHKESTMRSANKGQPQAGDEKGEISGGTGTIAKNVKGAQVGHDASALAPATGTKAPDALNISLRLEVDKKSPEGKTKAYGFSIPRLER